MKHIILVAGLLIGISGCSTVPSQPLTKESYETSAVIDRNKDKVWADVVSYFAENDYPLKIVQKDSGLLVTEQFSLPVGFGNRFMDKYAVKPNGFLYVWDGLKASVTVTMTQVSDNQTKVKVKSSYQAYETNVLGKWMPAESNGALEAEILNTIKSKKD